MVVCVDVGPLLDSSVGSVALAIGNMAEKGRFLYGQNQRRACFSNVCIDSRGNSFDLPFEGQESVNIVNSIARYPHVRRNVDPVNTRTLKCFDYGEHEERVSPFWPLT
jgi:hypothetical protein